jgi:SEC-C motif domain protein
MRSRYSAYALEETDYVWRTWHPRTRPARVTRRPGTRWTGLEIVQTEGDVVEFVARHLTDGEPAVLHERSLFERRAGRWFYVEAL